MNEIRIYYESLEQANDFFLPLLKNSAKNNNIKIEFKLIKLKSKYKQFSKKVSSIIFWKDPDILVTIIKDGEEIPILFIEFSNAVFTEDHELQRFDGLVTSAENSVIYIKISPKTKKSKSSHGGNKEFDYISSYAAIFKKYKMYFYHFDWPCDKEEMVIVNSNYVSCPEKIEHLEQFLDELIRILNTKGINGLSNNIQENLSKIIYFKKWYQQINNFSFKSLNEYNSSRAKFSQGILELKFNRFAHAMDPERGMLVYYGTLTNNIISKMIFSISNNKWYKATSRENQILEYIKKTKLNKSFHFLNCFSLASGLHKNIEFERIVKKYENKNQKIEIDITNFLIKNFYELNKSLRTIFRYSNQFNIEDEKGDIRVILNWNKDINFKNENNHKNITQISISTNINEDDISYSIIHNVLRKNEFRILAVSYPGAQADRVVLVSPGTGRSQPRKYIDIIAYRPEIGIILIENKVKFNSISLQIDIDKITLFKSNIEHKKGIRDFLQKFDSTLSELQIQTGIGFSDKEGTINEHLRKLNLENIDYIFHITNDMKKWRIVNRNKRNLFNKIEGEIEIPQRFEIKSE